VKSHRLWRTSK